MPFTLCIRGLTISVFEKTAVRTLLLNSGCDPSLQIPHHLSMLVLPRAAVSAHGAAPLPSLRGRASLRELDALEPDAIDRDYVGWDLTGLTVTTGAAGAPARTGGTLPLTHPDSMMSDWSDLHWVMDLGRFQPGATIVGAALAPGAITSAIVELTGGVMAGGVPTNGDDANWVWFFSPGITQAVTDTLTWTVAGQTTLTFADSHGPRGTVVVEGQGVGYLVNEATAADNRREIALYKAIGMVEGSPIARHARAYLPALELTNGRAPFMPVAVYAFMGTNAFESLTCFPLRA